MANSVGSLAEAKDVATGTQPDSLKTERKRGMSCHAQFAEKNTERQIATIHKSTIMLLL